MESHSNYKTHYGDPAKLELALLDILKEPDLIAPVIARLKTSACSAIKLISDRIGYPEVICTRKPKGSIYALQNTNLRGLPGPELFKPLRSLIASINRILSESKETRATKSEREDLQTLRTHYENFIVNVIEVKGKERLDLLKGPARLYGLEQVWLMKRHKARQRVSINKYNQPRKKNPFGAGAVFGTKELHYKCSHLNGLFPGQEVAVNFFEKRLFEQKTAVTKLIKIEGIWVRSIAEINHGRDHLKALSNFMIEDKDRSAVEFFDKYPDQKAKFLFDETRESYLVQVSLTVEGKSLLDFGNMETYAKLTDRSTSISFILSLVLRYRDGHIHNFMVDKQHQVVGIDNDQALGPAVGIQKRDPYLNLRSILLLLPEWNDQPLNPGVLQQLQDINPSEFMLQWLGDLHNQNIEYAKLKSRGAFDTIDYEKLSLPITFLYSSIAETYRLLVELKQIARQNPKTRWEIFQVLYPPIATLYEQLLTKTGNDPVATQNLLFRSGEACWIGGLIKEIQDDLLDPNDPTEMEFFEDLFNELKALSSAETGSHLAPLELAQKWLDDFPLSKCTEDEQISLLSIALDCFPNWKALTLSQNTLKKRTLLKFLERRKQINLVTISHSKSPVSPGAVYGMLDKGINVTLVDTDLQNSTPETIKKLKIYAKSKGLEFKPENTKNNNNLPFPTIPILSKTKDSQNNEPPKQSNQFTQETNANHLPPEFEPLEVIREFKRAERILILNSFTDLAELSSAFQVRVTRAFANDKQLLTHLASRLSDSSIRVLDLSDTEINNNDLNLLIKNMPDNPIYFELSWCKHLNKETLLGLINSYRLSEKSGNAYGQVCLGHIYFRGVCIEADKEMAVYLYGLAADQGLAEAQCCMGDCHRTGRGVEHKNLEKAVQFYELAAAQKNSRALHQLSICHARGEGVKEANMATAMSYLYQATSLGNIDACMELALRYQFGNDVDLNTKVANILFELAAEHGGVDQKQTLREVKRRDSQSPNNLKNGMSRRSPRNIFRGATNQPLNMKGEERSPSSPQSGDLFILDSNQDLEQLKGICKIRIGRNFATNETSLAQLAKQFPDTLKELDLSNTEITDDGLSLLLNAMPKDPIFIKIARCSSLTRQGIDPLISKYTEAAACGNALAWVWAGHTYINYIGASKKNQLTGATCYQNAADLKHPEGQYHLANCYEKGIGVGKEYAMATRFYEKAAEQQHLEAQYCLGVRHAFGQGVDQSTEKAMEWYRKAAEGGHPIACWALGCIYWKGNEITKKDLPEAIKFLEIASSHGDEDAQKALIQIEKKQSRPSLTRSISNVKNSLPQTSPRKFSTVRSRHPKRTGRNNSKEIGPRFGDVNLTPDRVLMIRTTDDLKHLPQVLKAKVSSKFAEDPRRIQALAEQLPSTLRELDLSNTKITTNSLNDLIKGGPRNPIYFNTLGCELLSQKGGRKSLINAYKKYKKNPRCHGLLLLRGVTDKPDPKKAIKYFFNAEKRNDLWATDLIGECYDHPLWNDPHQANVYYQRAADQGFASAQCHLAENLWAGRGFDKPNCQKAVKLYALAAEQGHARAQCLLADCYIKGVEIEKSIPAATRWLERAAKQGCKEAENALAELIQTE